MAATASGIAGALFDTDATQAQGGLSTGIGWGCNSVIGPPQGQNDPAAAATPLLQRIGQAVAAVAARTVNFPTKAVTYRINSTGAAIADGAAMPGGAGTDLNHTGKSCPPQGGLWATAP